MPAVPEVVVEQSADDLAAAVAARVVSTLNAVQRERELAHLVVTGGGILEKVLAALAAQPDRDSVDWARVALWWGDERFVPADSPDRNDRAALQLLAPLPFDPANVHRMPAADGPLGDDPDAAATAYERELPDGLGFDVILLGIGPDGHCASLFPGHPGTLVTDRAMVAVPNSPKPPPVRLSMTFPTLDAASEVWFIASGESKAHAVAMALSGAPREQVPSAGPKGRTRTLWLIDRAAAAEVAG